MPSSSKTIQDLLCQGETSLGKLIAQAQAIDDLNHIVLQFIDPALMPHCRVGCYQSGVLTIFVESATWATKLRYSVPTLLSQLRSIPQWAGLGSIQVKVQTHWHEKISSPPPDNNETPLQLSSANAQQLLALAETLRQKPDTEALVRTLEKLANKAK